MAVKMPSDESIIAMAGIGTFMATYAGISVTANAIRDAASIADKTGKGFISLLNRMPLERTLDRLGIGIIPNADPHTSVKNYNWIIERKTGLGTQEIGAMGLGLCAAAAIMWEMKHPYMGRAMDQVAEAIRESREQNRKQMETLLKGLGPEAQAKLIEQYAKLMPGVGDLASLIPLLA